MSRLNPRDHFSLDSNNPTHFGNLEEIVASIHMPPCDCADCEHGYYTPREQITHRFRYIGTLSDFEARLIAGGLVYCTNQCREYLVQRLATHGDIIIKRWKKNSSAKRQKLLVEAVPDICQERWIIPQYTFTPEFENRGVGRRSMETRRQLLVPWFNVEVLKSNPAVLFALLHNRTAHLPQDWTTFDARQLILGWASGIFDVEFSSKCVVMYGAKYGEVVDWEADPAHRSDIIGFPKARLILEAQAYLMMSLRKIVDGILSGVDMRRLSSGEKWKSMISLGFRHSNVIELWSPYTNQAFSSPPSFSIDSLISVAQTRLDATADHLWLLQTEPAYMKRFIATMLQGEYFALIDANARSVLIVNEVMRIVESCWKWSWVKKECEHVKEIHVRFRDNIAQGASLPAKYDKALGGLEHLMVNEVIRRTKHLAQATPQRPGFSHKWESKWKPDQHFSAFRIERKGGMSVAQEDMFRDDPLEFCLTQLQGRPDTQTCFDHALLFSFLENHLADSNFKEKSRVDEYLSGALSDIAACHEILVAVRLHRPQNIARDIEEVVKSEDRKVWKVWSWQRYCGTEKEMLRLGKALIRDSYEAKFSSSRIHLVTPMDVAENEVQRAAFDREIKRALQSYWEGQRKDCINVWKREGFSEDQISDELGYISASRTQEYKDTARAEEEQLNALIEDSQNHKSSISTPLQNVWGPEDSAPSLSTPNKSKKKTRPAGAPNISDPELALANLELTPAPVPPEPPLETPKIRVKKRAYEMLSHMYPNNGESSGNRIEWDNFVLAMNDMGFSARSKGGSAVVFEKEHIREGESRCGKIIFHRPHPESKIDAVILWGMGRRMGRRFGWGRGGFVMGDK